MFKKFLSLCIVSTFSVAATSALAQPNQLVGKSSPQQLAPLMKAASGKGIKINTLLYSSNQRQS